MNTNTPCSPRSESVNAFDLTHKSNKNILFSCELPEDIADLPRSKKLGWAVLEAMKNNPNLYGANLRDVDLYDADLRDVNLCDANLCNADLCSADLRNAYLHHAYLRNANLRKANLSGADLCDANFLGASMSHANLVGASLRSAQLSGAKLYNANLYGADLRGADLYAANLRNADLRHANLRDAYLPDDIPQINNIHQAVYAAASKPGALDKPTEVITDRFGIPHSHAGWVIHLAGPDGRTLEGVYGTNTAAALIYQASDPTLERIPDFYADNETALADMKRLAEVKGI